MISWSAGSCRVPSKSQSAFAPARDGAHPMSAAIASMPSVRSMADVGPGEGPRSSVAHSRNASLTTAALQQTIQHPPELTFLVSNRRCPPQ